MRHIIARAVRAATGAAALILLPQLTACGGSAATTVLTPPPPPGAPSAALLSIAAGDGQTAAPATALAVHPAVLVRDASGGPVSGITVTFAVDSGGGSLSAGTAVSGTNGIATAGVWTLGPAEGRNIVKVTIGSLVPVRIAATAVIAATTLPPTTIGSGGGSFTVLDAGPLQGFSVSIPAGALANGITLTVGYASSAAVQHGAHNSVVGPMVNVASSVSGYSTTPITVHIPAAIPGGMVPTVMIYDPVSGVQEPIPTLTWDSTGVTAAFSQLGPAAAISASRAGSVTRGALRDGGTMNMVVIITPTALLLADMTTAFLPGRDDWEFPATLSMLDSNSVTAGMAATALWYFAARPNSSPLWNQYQQAVGVPRSNRSGIRWAAVTDRSLVGIAFDNVKQWLMDIFRSGSDVAADNQFLVIRTLLAQAPVIPQPQLVVLWKASLVDGKQYVLPAIVYKAIGRTLYIADPNYPGDLTRTVTFGTTGAMNPYTSADGVPYDFIFPLALPSMLPISAISAGYQQVVAGTIGDAEFAPYPYTFRSQFGPIGDTLWIADSMTTWFQCTNCVATPDLSAQLAAATSPIAVFDAWTRPTTPGTWTLTGGGPFSSDNSYGTTPKSIAPTVGTAGYVVYELGPNAAGVGGVGSATKWRDWKTITYVRAKDTIIVTPHPNAATVKSTFTQQTQGPLPSQLLYTWDFNDGTPVVNVANNPVTTHTYAAAGIYVITGRILDPSTKQQLAPTATLLDTVPTPQFAWKFTSASAPQFVLPQGGIGSAKSDTLARDTVTTILSQLQNAPGNFRVFVLDTTSECRAIALEQFAPGQAVDSAYVVNAVRVLLGETPNAGPCATTLFNSTFAMGTLGSGVLTGSFLPAGTPGFTTIAGASINAVMNGTTLSGSFTWHVNYTNGVVDYVVQFSGTQVWPRPQ